VLRLPKGLEISFFGVTHIVELETPCRSGADWFISGMTVSFLVAVGVNE